MVKRILENITKIFNKNFEYKISAPDVIVVSNSGICITRYLLCNESNFGATDTPSEVMQRFIESYSSVLDKLPEGSEVKVVKLGIDLESFLSRISNEMMNIKASLDVVEEPHTRQKLASKLRVLESLYNSVIKGNRITRLALVVKIRSCGKTEGEAEREVSIHTSLAKNVFKTVLGLTLREANKRELHKILSYELGFVSEVGVKSIVLDNTRLAVLTAPIPYYKKPVVEHNEGAFLGIDIETGWPVIVPWSTLNKHLLVIGPTGRGKTTLLASIIESVTAMGLARVFAIDFKGDLASMLHGSGVEIAYPEDYPLNILEKPEYFESVEWAMAVSDVLSNILGYRRETIIKILSKVFHQKDDNLDSILLDTDLVLLAPIFELLTGKPRYSDLRELIEKDVVFNLGERGSAYQNTYGGLLLHIYGKIVSNGVQSNRLLVIDEAWRISGLYVVKELIKEARSRRIGIVMATQNPSDIPREIIENVHLIVMFGSVNEDYIGEAHKILGLPQTIAKKLSYLGVGEAMLINALDPHPIILRVRIPVSMENRIKNS
ncbi:MAG: helicase HerA-like domain-containing protein [Thermoprotei archaeon]